MMCPYIWRERCTRKSSDFRADITPFQIDPG
jgi:hypothetical protein